MAEVNNYDYVENSWYWISKSNGDDKCLVWFYRNPDFHMDPNGDFDETKDYSEKGFGFNIADGGGFVPVSDLPADTLINSALIS